VVDESLHSVGCPTSSLITYREQLMEPINTELLFSSWSDDDDDDDGMGAYHHHSNDYLPTVMFAGLLLTQTTWCWRCSATTRNGTEHAC